MLSFAVRNLLGRPMRTLLALLGLTVAIGGMVGLFSVAEGLDQMVASTFGRIPGLLVMQRGAPMPLFSRIPADWNEELSQLPGVSVVNAEIWDRVNVIDGQMIVNPPRFLFGIDIEARLRLREGVYRDALIAGRFLKPSDRTTRNTVVSRQIAEEFDKGLGDVLRVNGYDMPIVGIYETGSLLLDVAVILPINQVRAITRFDEASVSCFYVEQKPAANQERLIAEIESLFRGRQLDRWQPGTFMGSAGGNAENPLTAFFQQLDRRLKGIGSEAGAPQQTGDGEAKLPGEKSGAEKSSASPSLAENSSKTATVAQMPIEVRTAREWGERFDQFTSDLDIFLTVLTAIGLTIAVLSVVNTMLMSVTERVIEFGILKANGWTKQDVLKLVTFESALLGLGGGVLGCLFGWLGTLLVNTNWPTRMYLFASPQLLLFSLVFSTLLGILGGLYPAIWAMRMTPMESIRRG